MLGSNDACCVGVVGEIRFVSKVVVMMLFMRSMIVLIAPRAIRSPVRRGLRISHALLFELQDDHIVTGTYRRYSQFLTFQSP